MFWQRSRSWPLRRQTGRSSPPWGRVPLSRRLPPAEHEDIRSILSEFLDEGRYRFSDAGVLAQSGEATSLYYDIFDQEKNARIMVTGLGTGYLHKAIAVYNGDPEEELSMVIYENDNGACHKMTQQRMWFYDFYGTELG